MRTLGAALLAGSTAGLAERAGAQVTTTGQCEPEGGRCRRKRDCCKGMRCRSDRCEYKGGCGERNDFCRRDRDCCDKFFCCESSCQKCRGFACGRNRDCCDGFRCKRGRCR